MKVTIYLQYKGGYLHKEECDLSVVQVIADGWRRMYAGKKVTIYYELPSKINIMDKYRQTVMSRAVDIAKLSYNQLLDENPGAALPRWEDLPDKQILRYHEVYEPVAADGLAFTAIKIREFLTGIWSDEVITSALIAQGLIPDPAQTVETTTHDVSFSMDGLRGGMADVFNRLVTVLHENMSPFEGGNEITVKAEEIQLWMDGLRECIESLHCVFMKDVKHFTNMSDEADKIKRFNPDPEESKEGGKS